MRSYDLRLTVGFEETNLVGNVYYVNHIRWQGRCREMFLRDHAPGILEDLKHGLALVTVRVSCEYLSELLAFDEVIVRMTLGAMTQNQVTMKFDYLRVKDSREELMARGEQQIASMRREGERMAPTPLPDALREALRPYGTQ